MKAYIAAPIFTPEQLDVVSKLSSCVPDHWEIFSPYEASREIWKGRRPADCSPKERLKVTRQNYENVADSDVIICWLNGRHPDGRADTGVTWEMGFGYAVSFLQHRPEPVQIGFLHNWFAMPKDLNLMLTGTLDALVDTYAKLQIALDFLDNETVTLVRKEFSPERFHMAEQEVTGGEAIRPIHRHAEMSPGKTPAQGGIIPNPGNRHVPGLGNRLGS